MKTIKKHIKLYSLLFTMSVLFCSFRYAYPKQNIGKGLNLSGKEIFNGVMFGVGDLANALPIYKQQVLAFKNFSEEDKRNMQERVDLITNEIQKNNPGFFEEFGNKIKTGDPVVIDNAMDEAAVVMRENIKIIYPNYDKIEEAVKKDIENDKVHFEAVQDADKYMETGSKEKYDELLDNMALKDSQAGMCCSEGLACAVAVALYFVFAVHNTFAVVANVYLKFALWGPKLSSPKRSVSINSQNSLLYNEVMIEQLASVEWEKN